MKSVDKSKLQAKIDELKAEIERSPYSESVSAQAHGQMLEMIYEIKSKKMSEAEMLEWQQRMDYVSDVAKYHSLRQQVERYEESIKADLMYCPHRYVVASSPIVSPAGFDWEDRVALQPKIALHFENKPSASDIPHCNLELKLYDLGVAQ